MSARSEVVRQLEQLCAAAESARIPFVSVPVRTLRVALQCGRCNGSGWARDVISCLPLRCPECNSAETA